VHVFLQIHICSHRSLSTSAFPFPLFSIAC
jgi:hypothetical protein